MRTRAFTPGAVPISAISSTLPGTIPMRHRLNWNRTTARQRPSSTPPMPSSTITKAGPRRHCGRKTRQGTRSSITRPRRNTMKLTTLPASSITAMKSAMNRMAIWPFSSGPTPSPVSSKKNSCAMPFPIPWSAAPSSTTARKSKTSWPICDCSTTRKTA